MPLNARVVHDVHSKSSSLPARGRADLIEPLLPQPRTEPSSTHAMSTPATSKRGARNTPRGHKPRLRPLIRSWIHYLIYFLIQTLFGIYIRFTHAYHSLTHRALAILHHHYRSPEYIKKDVSSLSRIPEHLSIILKLRPQEDGALELLMDEVAELSAWSSAAGIPMLSVYEKSGILKHYMRELQDMVDQRLSSYFGKPNAPTLRIYAPNHTSSTNTPAASPKLNGHSNSNGSKSNHEPAHLDLLLLSATDGRDTLVDLTKTLTEMAQRKKLRPEDITSDLINTEIMATTAIPGQDAHFPAQKPAGKEVGAGEPDLVIVFGPYVKLDGYPPWQIRLSEMFCVGDTGGDINAPIRVEYQAFLRGLWKYAGAEMRFGR